jgi:hypothetical protein
MTKKRVSRKIQTSTLGTMPLTPPRDGGRHVPRGFILYDGTKEEEIEALTGFLLWSYIYGHFLGLFFYGGISPSKIGLIAPY